MMGKRSRRAMAATAMAASLMTVGAGAFAQASGSIKAMMGADVDPNANVIFALGAAVDPSNGAQPPVDDARWAQAAEAAGALKASATALMRPGMAKDKNFWIADAKLFRATAAAAQRAALARNVSDFAADATTLNQTCVSCHNAYQGPAPAN